MKQQFRRPRQRKRRDSQPTPFCRSMNRRGAFVAVAFFSLVAVLSFVALSIDLSMVSLTRQQMQNAVDAASLAAAQEINVAVETVGDEVEIDGDVEGQIADANSIAEDSARAMAAEVAALNGVYINPERDVRFGKRIYNEQTQSFVVEWDSGPYNVVEVTARRDNPDGTAEDKELELLFAPIMGHESKSIVTSSIAFVEARDIVMVLDYSGSMNDDSELRSISTVGQQNVEDNLRDIWEDLGSPQYGNMSFEPTDVTIPGDDARVTWKSYSIDVEADHTIDSVYLEFSGGGYQQFYPGGTSGSFAGTGSKSGKRITTAWIDSGPSGWDEFDFYSYSAIKKGLGLTHVPYPYPSGSWENFIDFCRDSGGNTSYYDSYVYQAGYRRKFGTMLLIDFWLRKKPRYSQTPDLWKVRAYPFHAMKEGASLFCNFLNGLKFGDELGLVSYDTSSRVETNLYQEGESIDISSDPITMNYTAIDTIQRHKQAGHYNTTTGLGYGIRDARELLDTDRRYGARPVLLVMTDGLANQSPGGFSLPEGWDWATLTDYDGDGTSDYTTSDRHKKYAFYQAKLAIDAGYTIHTLSVGSGADRDLMRAIAHAGGGTWIDVPGGSSVAEMEEQMISAFGQIAAKVPPAKLFVDPYAD